jgi:hypothetical protein
MSLKSYHEEEGKGGERGGLAPGGERLELVAEGLLRGKQSEAGSAYGATDLPLDDQIGSRISSFPLKKCLHQASR